MIGRYRVIRQLASGSQGTVYHAYDPGLEREVAVKVLHPHLATPEAVARFQREARIVASINHPNIAGISEIGEHDGSHFIAIEYVPHTTRELIDRGPLDITRAATIAHQAALALEAARTSRRGITHHDIKPDNLMLTSLEPDGIVKLVDFGIAHAADMVPTSTPIPASTATAVPTPTPYPIQPTYTPPPTSTPRPTSTPTPTNTPRPTFTRTPPPKSPDVPYLVSGPVIVSEPSVDSDGDGRADTYGPSDVIEIEVDFSEQVCGRGRISLTFQTGNGPASIRNANYAGCRGLDRHGVFFEYLVASEDLDGDGLSIAANSISLETYDGIIPDSTHRSVPADPNHRVDGRLLDTVPPRLGGVPGIVSRPSSGDTYVRGEEIWLGASFSEDVVVNARGGLPTLGLEIGSDIRLAVYAESESNSRRLIFVYTVQHGDRDDDGVIWVPSGGGDSRAGINTPPGSSITDLAGNVAVFSDWLVSSGTHSKVDGRRN